ncbi:MAG: glyoxalase, partial [Polaribacter sp.]|nr:glyoxalase [Polaribacter sp.]
MTQPFHLAIPVQNLEICRTFYRDTLRCKEGRSDTHWVDFNFF